jgi:alpha-tubulin suppressor-like RCC1 family protein
MSVDGTALCWGNNQYGGVGNGVFTPGNIPPSGVTLPTQIAGDISFRTVRAGVNHSCGLSTSGEAFCWGYNERGALGVGTFSKAAPQGIATPTPVMDGHSFVAIDVGNHTCATTATGDVYCWGFNFFGALGIGTITPSPDFGIATPTLTLFDLSP